MLLTIQERYALIGVLPVEGTFLTMKRLRAFREALGLTEEEKKEFGVVEMTDVHGRLTGQLGWNSECSEMEREIEVGESMNDLAIATLKKLNDSSKLSLAHVTLYEKFVEGAPSHDEPKPA